MSLKDNLKNIRKAKKISQKKLAEISGISYSMVCKLESGEQSNPSLETIDKISSALNIKTSELVGMGEYFDMKFNPNGEVTSDELKEIMFIKYLESIGYSIVRDSEVIEWHYEDVIENDEIINRSKVADQESFATTIAKGKMSTTMNEDEFKAFQATIEKSVEFEIFKVSQK